MMRRTYAAALLKRYRMNDTEEDRQADDPRGEDLRSGRGIAPMCVIWARLAGRSAGARSGSSAIASAIESGAIVTSAMPRRSAGDIAGCGASASRRVASELWPP